MPQVNMSIAFRLANFWNTGDCFIATACQSRIVHVELRLNDVSFSSYSDVQRPAFRPGCVQDDGVHWITVPVPITDYTSSLQFLLEMYQANLAYGSYWQCAIPQRCLRMVECDLDCERPDTWKTVFCSESILLFLKRCVVHGMLPGHWSCLQNTIARGCSPIRLYNILMGIARVGGNDGSVLNPVVIPPAPQPQTTQAGKTTDRTSDFSTVQDVSFSNLETLLARIQYVEGLLQKAEYDDKYCWNDITRTTFAERCRNSEQRIALMQSEIRALYRDLSNLLEEEKIRLKRHAR